MMSPLRTGMPKPDQHLSDGELRALLDGELSPLMTLRCRLHLKRCDACRAQRDEMVAIDRQVSALLSAATPRAAQAARRSRWRLAAAVGAAALLLGAGVQLVRGLPSSHGHDTGLVRVQDVCCFNLDGGERGDDGVLTVSRAGQLVDCVVLYEDRAGKRRFSPRDPLRFVSDHAAGCEANTLIATLDLHLRETEAGL